MILHLDPIDTERCNVCTHENREDIWDVEVKENTRQILRVFVCMKHREELGKLLGGLFTRYVLGERIKK
jgi:hypothetical protein